MKKIALLTASLVLVAGGATACGGGDAKSSSKSASKDDFCGTYASLTKDLSDLDPTAGNLKDYIKKLKEAISKLEDVGTPSDIPADARRGFEFGVNEIKALPDDATLDDLEKIGANISESDQADSDAFDAYLSKECPDVDSGN